MRVLLYQHQHDAGATMSGLIAYCRQGFEPELAAELRDRAVLLGIAGDIYAQRNHGFVLLRCDPLHVDTLLQQLHWRRLIFARQTLRLHANFSIGDLRRSHLYIYDLGISGEPIVPIKPERLIKAIKAVQTQ